MTTDSQKELFLQQKQFQDHMDKILKELELLRQQKEAVQVHNYLLFSQRKKEW